MTSLWFQPGMDNLKWVLVASMISLKLSESKQYSDPGAGSSSSCEQGTSTCQHTGSTGSAGDSPGGSCTCSRRWCSGSRAGSDGFPHTRPHLRKKAELPLSHISACLRGILWSTIYQHMNVKGNFSKTSDTKNCCWCSVAKLCLILCNPMHCSRPGFPVFDYLPEFAHIHVGWVRDALKPSHPLPPPSFAFSLSQHHQYSTTKNFKNIYSGAFD